MKPEPLAHAEREVILWLGNHGFKSDPEGRLSYVTETGQRVKVTPANQSRWLADLNRRRNARYPNFKVAVPTAEQMQQRWTPEGVAKARRLQAERDAAARERVSALLSIAGRIGNGPAW